MQVLELLTKLWEKEFGAIKQPEEEKPAPQPQKAPADTTKSTKPKEDRSNKYEDFIDDIPTINDAPADKHSDNESKKKNDFFEPTKSKPASVPEKSKQQEPAQTQNKKKPFEIQADEDEEVEMTEEAQQKAIEEQFQALYDGDPELRKVLEKSDVNTFSVEEKYQIIEAYMQGGGAAGLQIEL